MLEGGVTRSHFYKPIYHPKSEHFCENQKCSAFLQFMVLTSSFDLLTSQAINILFFDLSIRGGGGPRLGKNSNIFQFFFWQTSLRLVRTSCFSFYLVGSTSAFVRRPLPAHTLHEMMINILGPKIVKGVLILTTSEVSVSSSLAPHPSAPQTPRDPAFVFPLSFREHLH